MKHHFTLHLSFNLHSLIPCAIGLLIGILAESIVLTFILPQITLIALHNLKPHWFYPNHT